MDPVTKQVVLLAVHFTILFTAFNAFQNIVTRISEAEGNYTLGPFRFAVNYFAFMIANLFAPAVKYSQKWQIILGTFTYVLHYLTGFFISDTDRTTQLIAAGVGATINGIGASFLWTSVGTYIHKLCHTHGKIAQKGHYFGLFNTIFCLSTVFGALLVTFGLSLFNYNTYFILVSGVAFLAFVYGIIFIKDIKIDQNMLVKQENEPQSIWKFSKEAISSTLKFYPQMKYSLGLIALDGINIGVVTSTMLHLTPMYPDSKQNDLNAGYCLLVYGFGCILGGFLGGKLTDKLKIKLSAISIVVGYLMACLLTIIASYMMVMWMALLACFLWGFVLYYISALLMVICSRLYLGIPGSFAIVKQFHCFSFVIYEILAMTTKNSIPILYLMTALFFFGLPAIWGICNFPDESLTHINQTILSEEQHENEPT